MQPNLVLDKHPIMDNREFETELLKQAEVNWNKAIAENRLEDMAVFMDNGWIMFSGNGNIITKNTFLQQVKSGTLVHSKMDFEILRIDVHENTGLIMQRGVSAGTWQGKHFENFEIASSVFVKKNNFWIAVQTMIAPAD